MTELSEGSIEIPLQKVVLKGFENKEIELNLTFIASKTGSGSSILWTVQTKNSSINPIIFFGSFQEAVDELQKRVGSLILGGGMALHKHESYGEIRGNYTPQDVRKDGFVIRKAVIKKPEVQKESTLQEKQIPQLRETLILKDINE